MHVAVCIVGFRNADDIARCMDALAAMAHRDFEVVICENGGPEAARALAPIASSGTSIRVIEAPGNLGFAGGVNVCLRETPDADAWWVLNPDTSPHPEALTALLERLERGDCEAVGGALLLSEDVVQSLGGRWRPAFARAESIGYGSPAGAPVDVGDLERATDYLTGASMLIGRRFLEAVGPMRDDYFLYCEEVEWFIRARRLGMRLGFAPRAVVLHFQGTSTGATVDVHGRSQLSVYLNERNRLLLTRDCFPNLLPVAAVSAFLLILLRFARRGAWRQVGYALSGWCAGLAGRRGVPSF